jgi:hypothetical protein
MRVTERVRQEVLAETGVDFGRYRTAELAARLDVWNLGGRVAGDLLISMAAGLVSGTLVMLAVTALGADGVTRWLAAVGSTAFGAGVLALTGSHRLVRRVTGEVDTVFELAGDIADEAAVDLERVVGSLDAVVRGLVIVSAVPLVARVASRRFLVLAPVVRRVVEVGAGRAMDRALPAIPIGPTAPGPMVQRIAERLASGQQGATRRVGAAARWVALPFRVWGVAVGSVGVVLVAIALVAAP